VKFFVATQDPEILLFFCPGCKENHWIRVAPGHWSLSGSDDEPTVSPSVLVSGGILCHSWIRGGQFHFLTDSDHALAGQSVPMVPIAETSLGGA
jgi:hypothetical protein